MLPITMQRALMGRLLLCISSCEKVNKKALISMIKKFLLLVGPLIEYVDHGACELMPPELNIDPSN